MREPVRHLQFKIDVDEFLATSLFKRPELYPCWCWCWFGGLNQRPVLTSSASYRRRYPIYRLASTFVKLQPCPSFISSSSSLPFIKQLQDEGMDNLVPHRSRPVCLASASFTVQIRRRRERQDGCDRRPDSTPFEIMAATSMKGGWRSMLS